MKKLFILLLITFSIISFLPGKEFWDDFSLAPINLNTSYNSAYDYGQNDGAPWQGRGFNGSFTGGFSYKSEYVELSLIPQLWFSQNSAFDIMPSVTESEYGYFSSGLDLPQRMGDDFFWDFNLGQSVLRFNWQILTLGIGTENLIVGPGIYNQLFLSKQAEGFPHIDFGVQSWNTSIGRFDYSLIWGLLQESDYYDSDPDNDYTYFGGLVTKYSPSFIQGLTIGFNRALIIDGQDFEPLVLLSLMDPTLTGLWGAGYGNDLSSQLASATLEWKYPSVGFTSYLEVFKEDYTKLRSLLTVPGHTTGYTAGFSKKINLPWRERFLTLGFEHTDMEQSRDYELAMGVHTGAYYSHHIVDHGYTHKGQLLGGAVGPGGNMQTLKLDYHDNWGMVGGLIRRHANNLDYLYHEAWTDPDWTLSYDNRNRLPVEITYGIDYEVIVSDFILSGEISLTHYLNRLYIAYTETVNFHGSLGITYLY
jgi:hypothetical protein